MSFIYIENSILNPAHIAYIEETTHSSTKTATMSDGTQFRLGEYAMDQLISATTTRTLSAEPGRYLVVNLYWNEETSKLLREDYPVIGWTYYSDKFDQRAAPITLFGEWIEQLDDTHCLLDLATNQAHPYDKARHLQIPFTEWAESIHKKYSETQGATS